MKQEIAQQWVAALRSGNYKQGRSALYKDNKFCCLGVLCDLHSKAVQGHTWVKGTNNALYMVYMDSGVSLPDAVCDWAGMTFSRGMVRVEGQEPVTLARLNDVEEWSFQQIAGLIEDHFDCL